MSRQPRQFSSSGIYHVVLRRVNQQILFEDSYDYLKFLFILSDCKERFHVEIYAYCLMNNHIHLLIHSSPETLAGFFQSLETRFARWYNNKYARSGHLFQERYHSMAIETTGTLLNTLIYIHNNPVRAGICRFPSEYRWSSYNAYYGAKNSFVDITFAVNLLGSRSMLQRYFSDHENDPSTGDAFFDDHRAPKRHFTDEDALAQMKTLTNLSTANEITSLPKSQRNEIVRLLNRNGITQKQISRLLGISVPTVQRICKK